MIMCKDLEQRIKTLFLQPAESYALREVARLIGHPRPCSAARGSGGLRDAKKVRGKWRFLWRQAAYVAMDRWSLVEIQDALGDDAARVLPPLLTLREVTVRLPEYIIRAFEAIAAEEEETVDAAIGFELIEFAGSHLTDLQTTIPGYRQAYLFPGPL